ncbi:unnamed protein product [Bursaphelenchus okinawaensis]|uniref:Uncharacterized protein n=1 Tax=Bursaphelenchus okinawaensis TaxID=465554 RepID=A0A811KRR8_9BILA|nr:unnamed protein product [Bursaphelenchus okinawaensis]CAG9110338.1 unnamed protein product [Bursaphelenchus okinawaensis]
MQISHLIHSFQKQLIPCVLHSFRPVDSSFVLHQPVDLTFPMDAQRSNWFGSSQVDTTSYSSYCNGSRTLYFSYCEVGRNYYSSYCRFSTLAMQQGQEGLKRCGSQGEMDNISQFIPKDTPKVTFASDSTGRLCLRDEVCST